MEYEIGLPNCQDKSHFITSEQEITELMSSGILHYITFNHDDCEPQKVFLVPKTEHCVDNVC